MRKCHHHYQLRHGRFVCDYCGHKHYPTHAIKKIVTRASICIVIVVTGFWIYQQYGNSIVNYVQTEKPQETVINTITKTLTPPDEPTSLPMNMTTTAFYIHNLINEQRKANGLTQLSWNPKLAQAGLNHSIDMAKRNYFEHNDPEGHDFSYRYSQVGFNCQIPTMSMIEYDEYGGSETTTIYSGGGENIMYFDGYYGEEIVANQTVTGWMHSTGHRENILTAYFQSEGIGVAGSEYGEIYVTQDFC